MYTFSSNHHSLSELCGKPFILLHISIKHYQLCSASVTGGSQGLGRRASDGGANIHSFSQHFQRQMLSDPGSQDTLCPQNLHPTVEEDHHSEQEPDAEAVAR